MGIRTGYETGKGQGPSAGFRPQPGVTANILFSPDSPAGERFSARVDILPGNAYLVSAYNLPPDRRVFLNQISTGTLPGREKADGWTPNRGQDFFMQRFRLGGERRWTLSESQPQILLLVPGRYRFELEDEDMLGDSLQVEFYSWPLAQTPVYDNYHCCDPPVSEPDDHGP